jgi:MiaB-like tRNA modifying enzyme
VNTEDILAAVHAAASGRCFVRISEPREKFSLLRIRANPFVEIIPLAEGCLGSCTYCITRRARGALRSYPPEKIVERTVAAVLEGAREIWLTSQDSGAYGLDFGGSLPELLCGVLGVSGDFRVRVGMANPNHVIGFLDELLSAFADERVYRFLHVPVQSGNDRVLKDMGRAYSVDDFKAIVSAFRKKFDATISTDLIAGYPTEDESAFQDSVSLVKEVKPDILNVSRFWARPKTAAEKLKEFPGRETKRRSRILNQAFKEVGLLRNKKWVGWEGEALVSEKNQDGSYTARNSHYKPIILKSKENLLGKKVVAKITEATHFDLRGEVI